jgi:hypothetical protein
MSILPRKAAKFTEFHMFHVGLAAVATFSTGVPQFFVEASSIRNNCWVGLSSKHAGKSNF